jgi:hypothetical protein
MDSQAKRGIEHRAVKYAALRAAQEASQLGDLGGLSEPVLR